MKRQWTPEELMDEWTLHPDDLALIGNKGDAGRLGFAVFLKYFQREGRFPAGIGEIPGAIVTFLANWASRLTHLCATSQLGGRWNGIERAFARRVGTVSRRKRTPPR
jgi:hypothetical protein